MPKHEELASIIATSSPLLVKIVDNFRDFCSTLREHQTSFFKPLAIFLLNRTKVSLAGQLQTL